ncbi:hypothetical protein [Microvirga roseola]|uniref:hypothetical protein n=1 Tax=Microvirga roseola TaxID=2883126 RepID=UPI001E4AC1D1|nr:hypothetical protein [Microvirga roseola]
MDDKGEDLAFASSWPPGAETASLMEHAPADTDDLIAAKLPSPPDPAPIEHGNSTSEGRPTGSGLEQEAVKHGTFLGYLTSGPEQETHDSPGSVENPQVPKLSGEAWIQTSPVVSAVQQTNATVADHDAIASATANTFIDQIYESIVFVGGNTAVATAVNIAPVEQLNQNAAYASGLSENSYGSPQFNVTVADNDAVSYSEAGTYINYSYNSIIVVLGNTAAADALNYSPVEQTNQGNRPTASSASSFDELSQANWATGDSDSDATANSHVVINSSVSSMILSSIRGPASEGVQRGPTDGVMDHPLWDDFAEAYGDALA